MEDKFNPFIISIKDSVANFVHDKTTLKFHEPVITSVDIQLLFTNVPLDVTTTLIVLSGLLNSNDYARLNEKQITKALPWATVDPVFGLNDRQ